MKNSLNYIYEKDKENAPPGKVPVLVSVVPIITPYRRPGQVTRIEGFTFGVKYVEEKPSL